MVTPAQMRDLCQSQMSGLSEATFTINPLPLASNVIHHRDGNRAPEVTLSRLLLSPDQTGADCFISQPCATIVSGVV